MSLASLLSIARSALIVHQRAMEITGHNVANANTPGYSRQSLQLRPADPLVLPTYSLGRGVEAYQVTRSRDQFYDAAFRRDNGLLGQSTTLHSYLSQVESTLNEPSTDGVSAAMDKLFNSLSDLASDPTSHVNRDLVVSAGTRLASQLNSLSQQIGRMRQETVDDMKTQVGQVNSLTRQIADLNQKILTTEGPGGASSDLLDQRDALVDQLSQFMNVRVMEHDDGTIGIAAGDTVLVDSAQHSDLAVGAVGGGWGIVPAGGGSAIDPQTGSLAALGDISQNRLPTVLAKLDQLSSSFVTEFNNLHRSGFTVGGLTNIDFFDPTGTTAGTIRISAALQASSDNLAVSANGTTGNGSIATQLAGLATTNVASLGGTTFREFFVSTASGVGLDVANIEQDISARQTLVDRDDSARTAVSGVNVDEEMITLIASQQAYQAAAKLINVADQMVQQILQMI